jgi:hypothetical protein
MNNDLRNAITDICKKLKSAAVTSAAEINAVSNQLKRYTGHLKTPQDHELYMQFFSLVASYQNKWIASGINQSEIYSSSDEMQLLIKFCRELLMLLDVHNAEKARSDFLLYANGIINKLDIILNLIALITWKSAADKELFLLEATAIYDKLQAEGWQCVDGKALGLQYNAANFENKYEIFLQTLRLDRIGNDKYYKRPLDSMQILVDKLESLQQQLNVNKQESKFVTYSITQCGFFSQRGKLRKVAEPPMEYINSKRNTP